MKLDFNIEGMHCGSCAARITKGLSDHPEVLEVHVNLPLKKGSVNGPIAKESLIKAVRDLGYEASFELNQEQVFTSLDKHIEALKKELILSFLLTLPVFLAGMGWLKFPFHTYMQAVLTTVVLFYSGRSILATALRLSLKLSVNMDSLVAVGTFSAWAYSLFLLFTGSEALYFESAAVIISLILFGRYLEERAKGKASEAIRKLMSLKPERAIRLLSDGSEKEVPAASLVPGDLFLVRAGEKVPSDGIVEEGLSECDEAMISGESFPVLKEKDSPVTGGTINIGSGLLKVKTTESSDKTMLAQMIKLVSEAQMSKIKMQTLADKVALVFVPAIFIIALLTFLSWLFLKDSSFQEALIPAVSVLVIACPCALGLATPAAIVAATGRAAEKGILVRSAPGFESLEKASAVIFDKTGTLTKASPELKRTELVQSDDSHESDSMCWSLANKSTHPLSKAMVKSLSYCHTEAKQVTDFEELAGKGLVGKISDHPVALGNEKLLVQLGVDQSTLTPLKINDDEIVVYFAKDKKLAAAFFLSDPLRDDAKDAIGHLHSLGIKTIMATGDRQAVAQQVADSLAIDRVHANLSPFEKNDLIKSLKESGEHTVMLGDGINDAAALASADVGIAMGSGADAALSAADLVLPKADLKKVGLAISLSRKTVRVIKQNLFWAFIYNVIAVPVAASGYLSPMIAAGAMAFSSLSVVLNSLRLRSFS